MPAYCGYIRVSDDKLKTDGSRRQDIERQKEVLQPLMDEFKANNPEYEFAGWFSDDGKSAWTDDLNSRPAFAKMTNLVRANRLHWVFLEDLTRFSRNLGQGLVWLQEYAKKGCTVTSLHFGEHEVTSIKGWFLCNQLLMMAELESRLRSEKVTSGMINRLNKETAICGSCKVVHNGRHPKTCLCTVTKDCRARNERGGSENALTPLTPVSTA